MSNFDDIALSIVYFFESIPAGESVELRFAGLTAATSITAFAPVPGSYVDECSEGSDPCDPATSVSLLSRFSAPGRDAASHGLMIS